MSALTSLLVRDLLVPVQKIEEAIQRQVISGGSLDTVLLELDALPENVLAAYCAASMGLSPASREMLEAPAPELLQLVPKEVAERHGVVPMSREGDTLVIAVAQPLDTETLERLAFLIGVELDQRVAAAARHALALQAHYGIEPSPRIRRLDAKLASRDPGPLAVVAPSASNLAVRTGDTDTYARVPAPPGGLGRATGEVRRDTVRDGPVLDGPVRDAPVRDAPTPEASASARFAAPTPSIPVSRSVPVGQPPAPSEPPASGGASRRRIAEPETEALRRLRGPLTAERAAAMLAGAVDRDAILEIGFAFVRQFFDYTAAFVISDGRVEGLDGAGVGAVSFDALRRITLRLEEPSSFALASEGAVPLVTHLDGSPADRRVRSMLGRDGKLPAIFLPVAIRGRVVLVIYGDRSGEAFGLADVPEPVAFTTRLGDAFQKLILRRKLRARTGSTEPPATLEAPDVSAEPFKGGDSVATAAAENTPAENAPAAENTPALESDGPAQVMPTERVSSVPRAVAQSVVLGVLGVPRKAPPPPPEDAAAAELTGAAVDAGPARVVREHVPRLAGDPRADPASDPALQAAEGGVAAAPEPAPPPSPEPGEEVSLEVGPADPAALDEGMESIAPDPFEARAPLPREDPGSIPPAAIEVVGPVHVPPPRAVPDPDAPNVIVSLGDEFDAVVADVVIAAPDDESILQRVLAHGEAVLPALVREFPGPLWFDRHRPFRRRPRGRDVSAIARCIVAFGEKAAPYVVSLLDVREADARYYALLVAAELPHRSLVLPLGRRLFDEDAQVRDLAIGVLRSLQRFPEEMADLLERVRASAKVPRQTPQRRAAAARALGELRDPLALDLLVQLLRARERSIALAAHGALVNLTRQDYGDDAPAWAAWVRNNAERHRVEWLIDALLHGDELMRTAAGDELKNLTQAYFGYHPALPRRDREIAQRKYRDWWQSDGRARFGA